MLPPDGPDGNIPLGLVERAMYSEDDLDAAVQAGAVSRAEVERLRAFLSERRGAPAADEEQFRFITGFNDVFVTGACVMTLGSAVFMTAGVSPLLSAMVVAALSWGLAEVFTRRRRMALPSIVLLVSFVFACGLVGRIVTDLLFTPSLGANSPSTAAILANPLRGLLGGEAILGMTAAAIAATVHWIRFRVPITVAAGCLAAFGVVATTLVLTFPALLGHVSSIVLLLGLAMFGLGLWWDASDPMRVTRRSDVALWLHLAAAPMIVHPAFSALGLLSVKVPDIGTALAGILAYGGLAVVALAVDRRAILVSAQIYLLWAIGSIVRMNDIGSTIGFTGLIVGPMLLTLSAFWGRARRAVVSRLPIAVSRHLPPVH